MYSYFFVKPICKVDKLILPLMTCLISIKHQAPANYLLMNLLIIFLINYFVCEAQGDVFIFLVFLDFLDMVFTLLCPTHLHLSLYLKDIKVSFFLLGFMLNCEPLFIYFH